jgi:hypothetical protein
MLPRRVGIAVAFATIGCLSCAAATQPVASLEFFQLAPEDDPWSRKITEWQARHSDEMARPAAPAFDSELAREYASFTQTLKRRLAADAVRWTQEQSRGAYEPDGEEDHWATLSDVLGAGVDDCDGLDLLTFQLLREFGFERNEIVRSIVVHRPSGQHHMVTLWFENGEGDGDPFVLDPTGIVADGMSRLSAVGDWEPIEVFDEVAHYRVEDRRTSGAVAGNR